MKSMGGGAIKNLKAFHVFPAELRAGKTPPRICKWYFASGRQTQQRAMFSPQPPNRTGLFLFSPGFSSSFSICTHPHPAPPTLRSEKATGQAALVSVPAFYKPLCRPIFISSPPTLFLFHGSPPFHPFSLYRHFKFSIGRIFSILQAMNFLITLPHLLAASSLFGENASDNFPVNIYEKRPNWSWQPTRRAQRASCLKGQRLWGV